MPSDASIQRLAETLTVVLTSIALLVYSGKHSLFGSAVSPVAGSHHLLTSSRLTHTPAAIWGAFRFSDSSTNTIKSNSLHVSVSQGICQNKQKIRLQVSFSFYIKVSLKHPCMERLEGIFPGLFLPCLCSSLWAGGDDRDNCSSMLSICSSHSQHLSLSRLRLNEQRSPRACCEMLLSPSVFSFSSCLTEWLLQGGN